MYFSFVVMSGLAVFSMAYTVQTRIKIAEIRETETPVVINPTLEVERSHPLLVSGGVVTSDYGERYDGFHVGLDIASCKRDQILPYADGTIMEKGYSPIFGNWVKMWHTPWLITKYCHLSTIYWNVTESLTKYEPLGRTGETGMARGDHLHFEISLLIENDWVKVDPALYLKMNRDNLNYADFLMIWNNNKDNYK